MLCNVVCELPLYAFKEVHNLENDLAQQKNQPLAELKEETANGLNEAADTLTNANSLNEATDPQTDDQLQASSDFSADNSFYSEVSTLSKNSKSTPNI